jgi:hypothetical protein
MKKYYLISLLIFILLISVIEIKTYLIRDSIRLFLFDNVSHHKSCKDLPSKNKVLEVLIQNEEDIKKIIKEASQSESITIENTDDYVYIGNGVIWFESGTECESFDTTDISIGYQTSKQRKIIQKHLEKGSFKDIPVRLTNY